MNPEARCRAVRPCLEGSESRDRLSGCTHTAGLFSFVATDTGDGKYALQTKPRMSEDRVAGGFVKFLVVTILGIVVLPFVFGHLSRLGLGVSSVVLIVAAILLVTIFSRKGRAWLVTAAVVLWLVWSFVYPMYQGASRAMAAGRKAPAQVWEAAKEGARVAVGKLLQKRGPPGPAVTAANVAQSLDEAQKELDLAEAICRRVSFVKQQLGDEVTIAYCQRQDAGVFSELRSYIDAFTKGVAGPAYPFIGGDPAKLNSQRYLDCLREQGKKFPYTLECYQRPTSDVPLEWRLCMELGVQFNYDYQNANLRAPLAPEVAACRAQ